MFGTIAGSIVSALSAHHINQQNVDFQKNVNDLQVSREDSAYQRAVRDARAAGLSPLAVLGSGGASSQPLTAPQLSQNPAQRGIETFNALRATQSQIEYNNALTAKTKEDTVGQSISNANSQASYDAKLLKLYEEISNIKVTTEREREFLREYRERLSEELKGLRLGNEGKSISNLTASESKKYNDTLGVNPQASWSASATTPIGYGMAVGKSLAEQNERSSNNALKDKANKEALYNEYVSDYKKMASDMLSDWKNRYESEKARLKGDPQGFIKLKNWIKQNPRPVFKKPDPKDFGL